MRHNGTIYTKAKADSAANAEVYGVVSAVADADNFTLQTGGQISGLSGLTAGTVYFLSPSTAGAVTATEPSTTGHVSKPILLADSTTSAYLFNMRGLTIGGDIGATGPTGPAGATGATGAASPVNTVLDNWMFR